MIVSLTFLSTHLIFLIKILGIIHITIHTTHIIGIPITALGIPTITHIGFTGIIGTINMVIMVQIFTIKQTLISLTV